MQLWRVKVFWKLYDSERFIYDNVWSFLSFWLNCKKLQSCIFKKELIIMLVDYLLHADMLISSSKVAHLQKKKKKKLIRAWCFRETKRREKYFYLCVNSLRAAKWTRCTNAYIFCENARCCTLMCGITRNSYSNATQRVSSSSRNIVSSDRDLPSDR